MKRWIFFLAAALLATACGNDDSEVANDNGGRVEIDRATLNFAAAGESFDVTVSSEGEWRLAGRKTWCHPSVERGQDGDVVTFTAEANPGYEVRSETFTFVCGSRTVDLVVSQQQGSLFDAGSQRTFEVGPEGGDVTLVVASNLDYTYRIEGEDETTWLVDHNTDRTRGVSEDWLYFEVPANDTYGAREAQIVFEAEGMEPVTVTVTQRQNDGLSVEQDRFEFQDVEAHRIELKVSANVAYTVEIPQTCDWITLVETGATRALEPSTVLLDVAAGTVSRVETVTLRQVDGELEVPILISQFNPNANMVDIPDAAFRDALYWDGFILDASSVQCELTDAGVATTEINSLPACGVTDLTGIEAFENLEMLFCNMNQITKLDLSQNHALYLLVASGNPLEEILLGEAPVTSLDLKNNGLVAFGSSAASEKLLVSSEQLQSLDVSSNPSLKMIDISACPSLTSLKTCGCNGSLVIRMSRSQEGTLSVDKDASAQIEYVD